MASDNSEDNERPPAGEAVDHRGRPLSGLPDWQLIEDARSMTTHAFTLVNGLLNSSLSDERRTQLEQELYTHMNTRKQIPFMGRDGWIDISKRYPRICETLKREWEAREPLED